MLGDIITKTKIDIFSQGLKNTTCLDLWSSMGVKISNIDIFRVLCVLIICAEATRHGGAKLGTYLSEFSD